MKKDNTGLPEILLYGIIDADISRAFALDIAFLKANGYKEFNLRINSKGGDTADGVAMYSVLRGCGMLCNVYVDGIAASMASVLAFAGTTLYMNKYARLMMHKPRGGAFGTADEMRAQAEYIDGIESDMCEVYCKRTGLSNDEVKAQFLNGKNNFFTAKQADEAKLIDGTYDGEVVVLSDDDTIIDADAVYMLFQEKIQSKIQSDMHTIQLEITPELIKLLPGVTASADGAAVATAIKRLATSAKEAKDELTTFKNKQITDTVTAMLETALTDKKITVQEQGVYAKLFADKPEDLDEILKSKGVFISVTSNLQKSEKAGVYAPEVKALMDQGWDVLMSGNGMAKLKELSPEGYEALKAAKFAVK